MRPLYLIATLGCIRGTCTSNGPYGKICKRPKDIKDVFIVDDRKVLKFERFQSRNERY